MFPRPDIWSKTELGHETFTGLLGPVPDQHP